MNGCQCMLIHTDAIRSSNPTAVSCTKLKMKKTKLFALFWYVMNIFVIIRLSVYKMDILIGTCLCVYALTDAERV